MDEANLDGPNSSSQPYGVLKDKGDRKLRQAARRYDRESSLTIEMDDIPIVKQPNHSKSGFFYMIRRAYIDSDILCRGIMVLMAFAGLTFIFNIISFLLVPKDLRAKSILSYHGIWCGGLVIVSGLFNIYILKSSTLKSGILKSLRSLSACILGLVALGSSLWLYGTLIRLVITYKHYVLFLKNEMAAFTMECVVFAFMCGVIACYVVLTTLFIKYMLCNRTSGGHR